MAAHVSVSKRSTVPPISDRIQQLAKARVLVGVPQTEASRGSEEVNNAELLFIHTEGSPMRGIPARPVLQPAIGDKQNNAIITQQMQKAAEGALAGDTAAFEQGLALAGTAAANAAKDWFTNPENHWQENSPATIARKGSDRPLIDTGQLRRSITYVVDKDGTA